MKNKEIKRQKLLESPSGWKGVLLNLLITFATLLITVLVTETLFRFNIAPESIVMIYLLSVLVVSRVTPNYVYGIIAAIIATLACDYLINEPRLGFSFTKGSPITLITMLGATFLTSTLTLQVNSHARIAREREQRWQLMYETNQKLAAAQDADEIIELSIENLFRQLSRPIAFYHHDPKIHENAVLFSKDIEDTSAFSAPDVFKRVHRIFSEKKPVSSGLNEHKPKEIYYASMISQNTVWGVFGILCEDRPLGQPEITYVDMLTNQVSLALELRYLSESQSRIIIESEREKMRATLLRSISHDLRTPLTSIVGAGSAIFEQEDMERDIQKGLLGDIIENAEWLIRVVENILTITKISEDTMEVKKTPEAAEEVVAQTVSIIRKMSPECLIHARTPDELLMVPMDATLISQVLMNLLENAVKNSKENGLILIDLKKQGKYAQFEVSDEGEGIPSHMLEHLFETYVPRKTADSLRGMGLGLPICRTIVHAHGGNIEGYNRKEGGAKFIFRLPLEEAGYGASTEDPVD